MKYIDINISPPQSRYHPHSLTQYPVYPVSKNEEEADYWHWHRGGWRHGAADGARGPQEGGGGGAGHHRRDGQHGGEPRAEEYTQNNR